MVKARIKKTPGVSLGSAMNPPEPVAPAPAPVAEWWGPAPRPDDALKFALFDVQRATEDLKDTTTDLASKVDDLTAAVVLNTETLGQVVNAIEKLIQRIDLINTGGNQ